MKLKIFTVTGILVLVMLTCPMIASESDLTQEFRKKITPDNINSVNGYRPKRSQPGRSFFEAAIDEDDLGAIKFLLTKGADVSRQGSNGESPLHYAIRKRRVDIVRELLVAGANCNACGINNERPLHIALKEPNEQILLVLLNHQALRFDEVDVHGNIALHFAALCIGMDSAIVRGVIANTPAAKVNAQNESGHTALILAIRARNEAFAQELLTRPEIDLSLCNTEGKSVLHAAVAIANPFLSQGLIDAFVARANERAINKQQVRESHDTALILAIRARNEAFAQALLTRPEIDLSLCNTEGKSALHVAVAIANPFLSQGLMDAFVARANERAINKQQTHEPHDTALILAIRARNEAFAQELLTRPEIDLSLCNTEGNSPLHVAAATVAPFLSQVLVDALVARANEEAVNKQQAREPRDTVLIIAIRCNNIGFVRRLLAHLDIKPNIPDAAGKTPLHIAIEMGRQECLEALLACLGIDPNIPDATGQVPLHIAIEKGREECIKALHAHKRINHDAQDRSGNNPAHYAATAGLPLELRKGLLSLPFVNYSILDADQTDALRAPDFSPETKKEIVRAANLKGTNNNGNNPVHILAQRAAPNEDLVKEVMQNPTGKEAIHAFNTCRQLPCDIARIVDPSVRGLITPLSITTWFLRKIDGFSTHPDQQVPGTVEFVVEVVPQYVEQRAAVARHAEQAAAAAPQQAGHAAVAIPRRPEQIRGEDSQAADQATAQRAAAQNAARVLGGYVAGNLGSFAAERLFAATEKK